MDCIFCKIINGEIPSNKILEDDEILAFHDVSPQAPVHALVIPKRHIPKIDEMTEADEALLGKLIHSAKKVAEKLDISDKGYRLVLNNGKEANQTVFHIHVHLMGGRHFSWPPG